MRNVVFIVLITLISLCFAPFVLASSPFGDEMANLDWAYLAIEELAQGRDIPGLIIPSEPNRNQGAILVSRILQHLSGEDHVQSRRFGVSKNVYLDNMIFGYNQRVVPEKAFTAAEVETLYSLVLEFREELEVLGYAIQDFNLLYAQSRQREQGRLFTTRNLLYSEQALAAARKLEPVTNASSLVVEEEQPESIMEIMPSPLEPRNLWTGQFSSITRILPPSSSFSVQESQVGTPAIQIGGLELSSTVRSNPESYLGQETTASQENTGYGLSVRMGDVALQTALDLDVEEEQVKAANASLDLSWDWSDLFTFSAGYRLRGVPKEPAEDDDGAPVITSLGVTVPISRGQVHLGMTQEWNLSNLGGLSPISDELTRGARNTAELGLSYEFVNDSSLRLNYRLIDFSNVQEDYGAEAEAAFSIKF